MSGQGSLRRRLMAMLSASILSAWLATALFTYRDARREIDAMLEAGQPQAGALSAALADSIAAHLLHPLLVAIPVLGLVIWLAVGWGLAPLRALAEQVRARDPHSVAPLVVAVPHEARPLVAALDGLLGRVRDLLEHERRFTADAAHELRTPLAAIRTHAQVALASDCENLRREALAGVVQGTERAAHLVDQLLVLARLDAPLAVEPVALAAVAAAVVAEYAGAASAKAIDLGLVATPVAPVNGNPHLLSVLLRNLVDNAVRYGAVGGRIDVALHTAPAGVVLSVSDDGPGIGASQRKLVFARFHRGLGTGEDGSGLGLSIAARIAELHGGAITLGEGLAGRGLAATVTLPA